MTLPADPAPGLRSQVAKVQLLPGSLLLSLLDAALRLRSAVLEFDSRRERCGYGPPVGQKAHELGCLGSIPSPATAATFGNARAFIRRRVAVRLRAQRLFRGGVAAACRPLTPCDPRSNRGPGTNHAGREQLVKPTVLQAVAAGFDPLALYHPLVPPVAAARLISARAAFDSRRADHALRRKPRGVIPWEFESLCAHTENLALVKRQTRLAQT